MCLESYELKECPFCGSHNVHAGPESSLRYVVMCFNCRAKGPAWGDVQISDDDGYTLPEVRRKLGAIKREKSFPTAVANYKKERPEASDPAYWAAFELFLTRKAVESWNFRGK